MQIIIKSYKQGFCMSKIYTLINVCVIRIVLFIISGLVRLLFYFKQQGARF